MDENPESNVIDLDFSQERDPDKMFTDIKSRPYYNECQHKHLTIDRAGNTVTCNDCKKELSPMWVLCQIADKHNGFYYAYRHLIDMSNRAAKMNRCKCQYCGKMTKIVKN